MKRIYIAVLCNPTEVGKNVLNMKPDNFAIIETSGNRLINLNNIRTL